MESTKDQLSSTSKEQQDLLTLLTEQEVGAEKKTYELKQLSQSLQVDIDSHLQVISQLKQTISEKELHIENIELEKSLLAEKKESVIRMKAIADKDLESAQSSMALKASEITKLNELVEEKTGKLTVAEKTIENMRSELKDFNDRISQERDQVAALKQKIQENEEMISGFYVNIDELKDINTTLQSKCLAATEQEQTAKALVSDLNEKLANSKNELTHKESQIAVLEEKQSVMIGAIQRNAEVKVDLELLQTQYNILKDRADAMERTVNIKDDEIAQLKSENEANIISVNEASNESNQRSSDLQLKIRRLEEDAQHQMSELENSRVLLQEFGIKNKNLIKLLEESHETQRNELAKISQDYSSSNKELQTKIDDMEVKSREKDATILDMVTQIDELKVVYREQVNSLEQQLEANKLTNSNDTSRVGDLLKKLENYKDLEQKMIELERAHEKEKIFNDKMSEEHAIFSAKLMKIRQEKEEMQKSFEIERAKLVAMSTETKRKSDEDIAQTRLEMEGKLEKMKEKMVS